MRYDHYDDVVFRETAIPIQEALREAEQLLVARTRQGFRINHHDPLDASVSLVSINRAADFIVKSLDAGCAVDVEMEVAHEQV